MRALLWLYCRLLEPPPAGFVCFDRDLELVYPARSAAALPLEVLVATARRVLESDLAESDLVIEGLYLTASCYPLRSGREVVGVVFAIENPEHVRQGRELVMLADAPIAVFDARNEVMFANVAWQTLVPPGEIPPESAALLDRARRGEVVELAGARFGDAVLDGLAGPLMTAFGTIEGALVTCTPSKAELETAERARDRVALAEAQLANRQKDQFIATVSHELRAPLATMLLWEKVLRDDHLDAATHARALDAIHESAIAQSRLVADLLDVARAISGKLHVDRKPVAIDGVLAAAIEEMRPLAAERRIELRAELGAARRAVLGDEIRLRQVFSNLVTNALRCTDAGGRISVRSERRSDTVAIVVGDTGRGIPSDLLPDLFEPFRQGDGSSSGGLGLGLAVAKQLVVLHGGTLTAESAGVGLGATFTVVLPDAATTATERAPSARLRLGGVHVLVVDDDPRVLDALKLLLERAGAVVETARSAAAGCDAARRADLDIVLSDLAMPDGDGCGMMRTIRQSEGARRLPAIAMTAHVADANRHEALAAGFDRYLTKPLDLDLLIGTLAALVQAR